MQLETENITGANGLREEIQVRRLDPAERDEALNAFVWFRLGEDCSDEAFDDFAAGCEIVYRDDHDTGESWYQIVDVTGHGDGSGEWYPVE